MESPNVRDLLLATRLEPPRVKELLAPFGFKDALQADRNLQELARDPVDRRLLADVLPELLFNLSQSAEPDRALNYLERFASAALHKTRLFSLLLEEPKTLEILVKTLGASSYMAEILIRDPSHFNWVTDPEVLKGFPRRTTLEREVSQALQTLGTESRVMDESRRFDYLRFIKRRETLRIGVRDLMRIATVEETLTSLSTLADVLIEAAYRTCDSALRANSRVPEQAFRRFSVIGMGKLGGGELNFSSDIDLIYVYIPDPANGSALGAPEYFRALCGKITAALDAFTEQGYVYRVDLRLRPDGASGPVATPLDGAQRYYSTRAETWERLALLKSRPVAGDRAVGRAFLNMGRSFAYGGGFDDQARAYVRGMKRRVDKEMAARGEGAHNVKLGTGGIREIELAAQSLQVGHGAGLPRIRQRNTLAALKALREVELLNDERYATLTTAYRFLRDVENKLQMVDDAQTHALPRDEEALTACARRLGYRDNGSGLAAEQLRADHQRHTAAVNRIFEEVCGAEG